MTDLNLTQLQQIALRAPQFEWDSWMMPGQTSQHAGQVLIGIDDEEIELVGPEYGISLIAAHIATFDPPTALALIARIENLEAENKRLRIGKAAIKARTTRMLKELTTRFNEAGRDRERWYQRAMHWCDGQRRAEAAIQRVRDLHKPVDVWNECAVCTEHAEALPYPCPTVLALEGGQA